MTVLVLILTLTLIQKTNTNINTYTNVDRRYNHHTFISTTNNATTNNGNVHDHTNNLMSDNRNRNTIMLTVNTIVMVVQAFT